ncbi:hypothetical protein [Geomesophilobacter sediminis]|uniref:DUF2019 domain-containing protein n=1 Tax=Geomesophilobacter sediminis TaxID=2798584 RepID=A0A8J7LT85_9BACT|nr:hypothetical protein [Geomesophilobacter sediminis]MBJ6723089.1 hypothetical protein [Geomesophilobacter sediminis]
MQPIERQEKLVQWFAKASLAHAQAIEEMAEFEAAAQVTDLNRYFAALKKEGGIDRLLALLDHPDPAVSGMVAVYCMRLEPKRCSAQLKKLSTLPGMIGFRAEAALKRWEAGEWSL